MDVILVTGGAGFIGSHLCDKLLKEKHKVICIDNLNSYYSPIRKLKNIEHNLKNKNFIFRNIDITHEKDLKNLFNNHRIDKIVHLAAKAGVRGSLIDPKDYLKTNTEGTLNLLELAKEHKIKNFIFGSSSSVYGNTDKIPFNEEDIVNPVSPYGTTKVMGEQLCKTYNILYGLKTTCLRFFTVYGPRGRPDMAVYKFIESIYKNKPIDKYGDGTTRRDYTYIGDIVEGIYKSLNNYAEYEIINLGNSKTVDLNEFIKTMETVTGKKAKINELPKQKGDVDRTFADINKAKKLLNYEPKIDLKEGLKRFVKWYKDENYSNNTGI